jgi:hypothetical protein
MASRSSVVGASVWMVLITVVLFFAPVINGLVGGLVGGYRAGAVGRALLAALLPAVVIGALVWLLVAVLVDAPGWGLVAGVGGTALVALSELSLFLGAAIGGLFGRSPPERSRLPLA